jgi:hypothetical protein
MKQDHTPKKILSKNLQRRRIPSLVRQYEELCSLREQIERLSKKTRQAETAKEWARTGLPSSGISSDTPVEDLMRMTPLALVGHRHKIRVDSGALDFGAPSLK